MKPSTPSAAPPPGRIGSAFERVKRAGRIALMPFIPAGYPDLQTTTACLIELQNAGADLIEIGFPFSDPIADGPVIQAAFTEALAKHLKVTDIFTAVRLARASVTLPLVAMVSYSIIFRFGREQFFSEAKNAGFDGVIIPDLPPPEADRICQLAWNAGLDSVLLIAPSTGSRRRAEIARLSTGFIYYLSVAGITGERTALPADLPENVRQIKQLTDRPVCVGFGLHTREQVLGLTGIADGAIVGSAFVKRMKLTDPTPNKIARAVADYCRQLTRSEDTR